MRKYIFLYFALFSSLHFYAQQWKPLYVSNWTYLYEKSDQTSGKIGILATEASVKLLDSTKMYYKVAANNGDVGFIIKQNLKKSMRGNRDTDEPKEYFYRGTEGHQCPHLYIQVSGLRARTEPNTISKISAILPINKMECIEYLPISKNGWVYIGDHFHKNPAFVQYKFLGKEISFKETLDQFERTKEAEVEKQKTLLERLVEIGWNSDPKNTLKALQLFKTFHQNQGTLATIPNIDFELFLAENIQNPLSPKARSEFNYNKMTVNINGTVLNDGRMTETQVKSLSLQRINDYSQLPNFSECGWEPVFSYVNKSKNLIINFEKNNAKIYGLVEKLNFLEGHTIFINNFRLDQNTSEMDFIKKFGKIMTFDRFNTPGTYYLPDGDAGFMEVSFKNKKAVSYQHSFYC